MKNEQIKLKDFLVDMGYELPKRLSNEFILDVFYEKDFESVKHYPNAPFIFVEEFEQRGDGQGYETFWVFQRKSDNKFFYYYSYDGRVEQHELIETKNKVTTKWDFEDQY